MRRGNKASIAYTQDGIFFGFCLGADYCAEHEWGTKGIEEAFGIPAEMSANCIGLNLRKALCVPPVFSKGAKLGMPTLHQFSFSKNKRKYWALLFDRIWEERPNTVPHHLAPYIWSDREDSHKKEEVEGNYSYLIGNTFVWGAWDSKSFGVVVEKKYKSEIQELWTAFTTRDVVIARLGGQVFQNAGLWLMIASRIPKELIAFWEKSDNDALDIKSKDEVIEAKTHVKERLKAAGKDWFALSPRLLGEEGSSKYPLVYWLNPSDQQNNNYGWFTVEDLEDWLGGKGKIPK